MVFILSKLLAVFLSPANWLVLLLITYFIVRPAKLKKRLLQLTALIAIVFTNPWLFRQACLGWQTPAVAINQRFDVAILPGGLSGYDRHGLGYFSGAADRFIQTTQLYHRGLVQYIIVTGGNGRLERNYLPEAVFLQQQLVANGIPAARILVESNSRNTRENALFSKKFCDSMHFSSAVLVTSALHMPRCQLEFKKAGVVTAAMPCNYEVIPENTNFFFQLWPDFSLTQKWSALIKEWVGYLLVKLR
jgi:uncharacterized SAM-binding protein YcdF (DUF218 family)